MTYGTKPGRCIDNGGKKAPAQYREDVMAALINAGIKYNHAEVLVIDNRSVLLESHRNKFTAQQVADGILSGISTCNRSRA